MKTIMGFLGLLVFAANCYAQISEVAPPNLTLKTDKQIYFPGDRVKFTYEIKNTGTEEIRIYRGELDFHAFDLEGREFELNNGGAIQYGSAPPDPENYISLKADEIRIDSIEGTIGFGDTKNEDGKTHNGFYLALHDLGPYTNRRILLSGGTEDEIAIAAQFTAFGPNAFNFTPSDCEDPKLDANYGLKDNRGEYIKWELGSYPNKGNYKEHWLSYYCQNRALFNNRIWAGSIKSEPIKIKISQPNEPFDLTSLGKQSELDNYVGKYVKFSGVMRKACQTIIMNDSIWLEVFDMDTIDLEKQYTLVGYLRKLDSEDLGRYVYVHPELLGVHYYIQGLGEADHYAVLP